MRVVSFLSKFYLPLVLLLAACFAWRPLGGGDDFWAHAAIGRWTLENGTVPTRTLYLWSADEPYIAHAYATGIWFYALLKLGGPTIGPFLALGFNTLMCAFPWALLWRFGRRYGWTPVWITPFFVWAIWLSALRFQTRPELFTALFLTFLYLILQRDFSPQNRRIAENGREKEPNFDFQSPKISAPLRLCGQKPLFFLIPIFALWPHFHGAVLFGLLVLWLTVACDFAQFRRAAWPLFLVALVATLAVFALSPYGFGYARNWNATGSDTFKRIDEWKPFWGWPQLATYLWAGEIALWLMGTLLWALNPHRRWAHLAWMLLMGAAFLRARRGLWLTALTSLLVILSNENGAAPTLQRLARNAAENLAWNQRFRRFSPKLLGNRFRPARTTKASSTKAIFFATHASVLALLCWSITRAAPRAWPLRATQETLPVALNAELQKHAHRGRIWNDYEFSAAHEWFGGAKTPLWIDLNNAYPDRIMNDYFEMMESDEDPIRHAKLDRRRAAWFERNRIRVVVLRPFKSTEGISIVARWLDSRPDWTRVYGKKDGTIWIKKPAMALARSR